MTFVVKMDIGIFFFFVFRYRMLAQVYAAEALLQLNKINEAIEHLDLNSLQVKHIVALVFDGSVKDSCNFFFRISLFLR